MNEPKGMQVVYTREVPGQAVEQARESIAVMKPQEIDYVATLHVAAVEIAYLRGVAHRRMKLIREIFNDDAAEVLPSNLKQRMSDEFDMAQS